MSIPNIQQQLYLKKALNEDTNGMFDHPTLDEGSYVHSKKQLKSQMSKSIAEGLLRRYNELTEARRYYGGHLSIYGTPTQAKIHLTNKYGPGAYGAILKAAKNHKGSLPFTTADVHRVGTEVKKARTAAMNKPADK